MSSLGSSSSCYQTDEEEDQLLLSGGALIHHLEQELPNLAAHTIHDTNNDSLGMHFPLVNESMIRNGGGEITRHCHRLHRKTDKMLKEIKDLKRQNFITNCLLGTMIVLTLGWQLSEVSLLLALKNGFTHPFKSIGNLLSRMVKRRSLNDSVDETVEESSSSSSLPLIPAKSPNMLGMKMPELPKFLDVSKWGNNDNRH